MSKRASRVILFALFSWSQLNVVRSFVDMAASALALKLAEVIALPITDSQPKMAAMMDAYRAALSEARRVNAVEIAFEPFPDDAWILARDA